MNSETLFNLLNSFFAFCLENPLSSSEDLLNANNLKSFITEIDDGIGKNLQLTYDNSLTYKIINLTEVKTQLLSMIKKSSKFNPSDLFNNEIEKLDISKLANKSQNEIDSFIKLLIISALLSKESKNFGKRINEKNKSLIANIIKNYLNMKVKSQSEKKENIGKKFKIIPKDNNNDKGNKPEEINLTHVETSKTKENLKEYPNNLNNKEKELREKIDNEISISMEKDISKKELNDQLKENIENEKKLKNELDNINLKLIKQDKMIKLLHTNEVLYKNKIKNMEEEYNMLSLKLKKIQEISSRYNPNIFDNPTKEFELISGAMFNLGCIFWENKTENYQKKENNKWLDLERSRQYNESN